MKFALTIMVLIAVAHPAHAQNCQQLADQAYWAAAGQGQAYGFGPSPASVAAQAEIAVLTACRAGQPANPYVPVQQPRQPIMCTTMGNWLYCQ